MSYSTTCPSPVDEIALACDGEVPTCGAVAQQMAAKMGKAGMSSQAVSGAVGRNSASSIIPCHRVVGATGGIAMKIKLLELEGFDTSRLSVQTKGTAL